MPIRQCVPGQFYLGEDEEKSVVVNVGNFFTAPTQASAVIKEGATDRSASNFSSGATSTGATISGSLVTTPCIVAVRAGADYKVELLVEQSGEKLECYFYVAGET